MFQNTQAIELPTSNPMYVLTCGVCVTSSLSMLILHLQRPQIDRLTSSYDNYQALQASDEADFGLEALCSKRCRRFLQVDRESLGRPGRPDLLHLLLLGNLGLKQETHQVLVPTHSTLSPQSVVGRYSSNQSFLYYAQPIPSPARQELIAQETTRGRQNRAPTGRLNFPQLSLLLKNGNSTEEAFISTNSLITTQ
jgi:hypothetical protein